MLTTLKPIETETFSPAQIFSRLRPLGARCLLESAEYGGEGRFSFIAFGDFLDINGGAPPGAGAPAARAAADALTSRLADAIATASRLVGAPDASPFKGGLIGCAAFEFARAANGLANRPDKKSPLARYLKTEAALVFDHAAGAATAIHRDGETTRRAFAREIEGALRARPAPSPVGRIGAFTAPTPRNEFADRVARAKRHIRAGDVYQLVLSLRRDAPCDIDPFTVYCALRRINPSPYMFFLDMGPFAVAGASPEALVTLRNGRARVRPIAGTRPRGADDAADTAHEAALLRDPKERAEHVMLVDMARNDLRRCAIPGTTRVEPFMSIEKYSHVMHIVSGVEARLAPGRSAADLFVSTFPAGTLVGAPKKRAMELIEDIEPFSRGLYGGAVGYFGADGSMDQAIAIRMLTFAEGRCAIQAGAGIVADSDAEMEYDEIEAKGAAMRQALAIAGGRQ